jgi:hypothetical protein
MSFCGRFLIENSEKYTQSMIDQSINYIYLNSLWLSNLEFSKRYEAKPSLSSPNTCVMNSGSEEEIDVCS